MILARREGNNLAWGRLPVVIVAHAASVSRFRPPADHGRPQVAERIVGVRGRVAIEPTSFRADVGVLDVPVSQRQVLHEAGTDELVPALGLVQVGSEVADEIGVATAGKPSLAPNTRFLTPSMPPFFHRLPGKAKRVTGALLPTSRYVTKTPAEAIGIGDHARHRIHDR